jgi:protein-tyrosine phosphatase
VRILFVCLGNICRSPTAEGVLRRLIAEEGLSDGIEVQSAGTGAWHVGNPPDPRSTQAAARRGTTLSGAARQVADADFAEYDLLLAMDAENLAELRRRAPAGYAPGRIRLLREFDPAAVAAGELDVPDPYYGGPSGFDDVLDMIEAAGRGLLDELGPRLRERSSVDDGGGAGAGASGSRAS